MGFQDHGIFRDETAAIVHAQLSLESGMIMRGPDSSPDLKEMFCTLDHLDGKSTQAIFVVVDDADAHYKCAVEADAKIIEPIADADFGGRQRDRCVN